MVSGGELRRALATGIPGARIVFSGVGKTPAEMVAALDAGISQFNVESEPELDALAALAAARGATADIALRINPDVDATTHAKITTGRHDNKFGIAIDRAAAVYARAHALAGVRPVGIAVHIGSQLTALGPFEAAFRAVADLVGALRGAGHEVARLDLGGGLGIAYAGEAPPSLGDYAALVRRTVGGLDCALVFEPGRRLVAAAGVLVCRVVYVKDGGSRRFIVVDAAMNDLLRPALYEAWHDIVPVRAPAAGAPTDPADVVGPICETGDTFAAARELPALAADELVVIRDAGAYGAVMASTYNGRPLVPEVLVSDARFAVVRERPSEDAMLALDQVPDWLDDGRP